MRLTCSFLSEAEKQRIHANSLEILAKVGVKFSSARALKLLAEHGARVDPVASLARIPPELVEQALQSAPKSFVLAARNPAFDAPLPAPFTGYTLDGAATFALDFQTGQRRPDVYQRARRKVETILAEPPPHPLPAAVLGQFEEILRRADTELE
jgi:trimethylamine--corrinoid protein Co-methyltransferase